MEEQEQNRKRKFIQETIVPRKRVKRILAIVGAVVGLGLLFGLMSGVAFSISRNIFGEDEESGTSPVPIVIARDETTEAESETRAPRTTESTETEAESTEDESTPSSETESETETETEPETEATLRSVYMSVRDCFTVLSSVRDDAKDFFDQPIVTRTESFGVFIAETEETVLILTDIRSFPSESTIYANVFGTEVEAVPVKADSRTGLLVLQIWKTDFNTDVPVIALGNSFTVGVGQDVYMIGAPDFRAISVDEGKITYIETDEPVTDGYIQHIYTNMTRSQHGTAALIDEKGALIGWVSDYACGNETGVSAAGISPMKYLVEDLCSGVETAYLGVICEHLSGVEAAAYGIPSGLYVMAVEENSPAYLAGIQTGDRIVSMNERMLLGNYYLAKHLDELSPGAEVTVVIQRAGTEGFEELEMNVTLGSR